MKTCATNLCWMVMGAGLAFSFLQPGFALEQAPKARLANASAKCSAKIGPARFTVGDRCFRDEVMVGRWDDNIYCASIEIVCE